MLADDFFRLAHHDITGRVLLHPVALSTGLAAALVGELVADHHLAMDAGHLLVVERGCEPCDGLSSRVLTLLRREAHPLRTWLEYLAQGALVEVTHRLERAGQIRVQRTRRLLRETVTFVPTNVLEAARPRAVLATRLMNLMDLDTQYVVLAGLMAATGLDTTILSGAPADALPYLRSLVARLPDAFLELLATTEAVVGAAVLAHRT